MLPDDPEDYVHRIGRTGRAGEKGASIIFATEEDAYLIPKIETYTKHKLNYINPDEEYVIIPKDLEVILKKFRAVKGRGRLRDRKSGTDKKNDSRRRSRRKK